MIHSSSLRNVLAYSWRQRPSSCLSSKSFPVAQSSIKNGHVRSFKTSATLRSSLSPEQQAKVRLWRRQTLVVGGGLLLFFSTALATMSYVRDSPKVPNLSPGQDVSDRYEHIADRFDNMVESSEWWTGISKLRKKLLKQARGNVLEVSVGTGRNSQYYIEKQCMSITMIDQSKEMIEIAEQTFKESHPWYKPRKFIVQSALQAIAAPPQGFDTIVQTMGLCSTHDPVGLLKRMGSVLKPETGRILLLEHGHGHYDWLNQWLDESAANHANKYGCWWNKDIDKIVAKSGLEIVKLERHSLGTTWWVELKLPGA